jgi:hypothetical protein
MGRNSWEKGFDKRPVRTGLRLTLAVVGCVLLVAAIVWGVTVVVSGIKGQGDSVIKKNSADNFISAQATFERDNETYKTFLAQIKDAKQQLDAFKQEHGTAPNGTPYDPTLDQENNLQTALTGLKQQCQNTVTDYNTKSRSYLSEDFKDNGLPESLDPTLCSTGAR